MGRRHRVAVAARLCGHIRAHPIAEDLILTQKTVVTLIALTVGLLHFVTGESYRGPFPAFVNGYLIDILLPMALYLLLGLFEVRQIRSLVFRAIAIFLFGCAVETSQYLGRPIFGSTFDPLDILAYAGGIGLGLILDQVLFPRLILQRK